MKTNRMWLKRTAMLCAMVACALGAQGVFAGDDVVELEAVLKSNPPPRAKVVAKASGAFPYEATGDLNVWRGSGYSRYLYLYFDIPSTPAIISSASVSMNAYDVDWPVRTERDIVYFNEVEIGRLEGGNQIWNENTFIVPASAIHAGRNTIKINVDVDNLGWVTKIAWATLTITGREKIELSASDGTVPGGIDVVWTDAGSGQYELFRGLSKDGPFNRIAVVSTNAYFDSSVEWGRPYWYYVNCVLGQKGTDNTPDSNVDEGLAKSNGELPKIEDVEVARLWLTGKGPYNVRVKWNSFNASRYIVDQVIFKVQGTSLEYTWRSAHLDKQQLLATDFDLSAGGRTIEAGLHGTHELAICYSVYDTTLNEHVRYSSDTRLFPYEGCVAPKVFFEKYGKDDGGRLSNWYVYWPKDGAIGKEYFAMDNDSHFKRNRKFYYAGDGKITGILGSVKGYLNGAYQQPKAGIWRRLLTNKVPNGCAPLYALTGDCNGHFKVTDSGVARGAELQTDGKGSVGVASAGLHKLACLISHERRHESLFRNIADHGSPWTYVGKSRINSVHVLEGDSLGGADRLLATAANAGPEYGDYYAVLNSVYQNGVLVVDSDGDGLSDSYERGIGFDPYDSDKYALASRNGMTSEYSGYGDNEVLARQAEANPIEYFPNNDWAFPGSNIGVEYQRERCSEWEAHKVAVMESLQAVGGGTTAKAMSLSALETSSEAADVEDEANDPESHGGTLDEMPELITSKESSVLSIRSISGGYAEWDTNGMVSAICYDVGITNAVGEGVSCLVKGYLGDANDLPVAWATAYCESSNSFADVRLFFAGDVIYPKRTHGLALRYLTIEATGDVPYELYDTCVTNVGTVAEYGHEQFARKDGYLFFGEMLSSTTSGAIRITVPMEITGIGEFSVRGVLETTNGVFVASATASGCTNGQSVAQLVFSGDDIYQSCQDGPYCLASIQLLDPRGVVIEGKWDSVMIDEMSHSEFRPTRSMIDIEGSSFRRVEMQASPDGKCDGVFFTFNCVSSASNDLPYRVSATLLGTNNAAVAFSVQDVVFAEGTNTVAVSFAGNKIRSSEIDGPYTISEVILEPIGDIGVRERFLPKHAPIVLEASDFGRVPFTVKGAPQYREADGVNPAAVVVTVDVARPDTITASALLVDGEGKYVATATTSETVGEAGERTLTLSFDPDEVNASGRRGPYTISYLLLKSGIEGVEDIRVEDFEVKNVGDSSLRVFVDAANGDDENDGATSTSAKRTISAAIEAVADGDKVVVAAGVYEPFTCTNRNIVIESVNGLRYTIIDGGGTNRCATLGTSAGHTNTVLRGFTLRNGNANGNAVAVSRNYGGGAYCGTIESCRIYGNTAYYGGGISYSKVVDSLISGNNATSQGGAIYLAKQSYVQRIERCSICQNSSSGSPVQIVGNGEPVVINGCLIAENFYRNWFAVNDETRDHRLTITNTTIVGNSSLPSNTSGVGYATVIDSIVWDNFSRPYRLANHTSSRFQNSCTYPLPSGVGNIEDDPQFVDEAHHVYLLKPGSPCAGAATDGGGIGATGVAAEGGFVVGTETDGYGLILESGTVVEQGGTASFTAVEIGREFLHFKTNGVFATAEHVIDLTNIKSDILVTAVFGKRELFVDGTNGNDGNNGFSWMMAKKSISSAINDTLDYDTIFVTNGVYGPITPSWKKILIQSANGASDTIIDGGGSSQCINCLENGSGITNAVIVGFTLRNGFSTYYGGGVIGGVLRDCVIVDCEATTYGGGACNSYLENCVIARNRAGTYGGGTYYGVADHCTICGNEAGASGGGTYYGTINNCIVSKNVVGGNEANWSNGTFDSCCTYPNRGNNPIAGDPMLVDGWNGDARLRVGSPCIVNGVQVCGAYVGEPIEGIRISVGVQGSGAVSNETILVTSGENAVIEAVETVRPFLYWIINGEQVEDRIYTLTNVTADIRVIAVFGTYDWYVDAEYGDDANDGSDWDAAKRTLQAAVAAAVDDEVIYVEAGTYAPISTDNKRIRIESVNGAEMTFIDGGGMNRCATLGTISTHTNSALIGFTLLNGRAPQSGSYAYGGGSYYGTLEYCIISNCVANGYYAYGGGAYYGNLNNCLVVYNCATSSSYRAYGGGTYGSYLRSTTIARNRAIGVNAAYYGGAYGDWNSAYNSIIWDNEVRSSNASSTYYPNTYATYLYYCCTDGTVSYRQSGCVTNDPQFVDADVGDFHLMVGSPCVNTGYDWYVQGDMDLDWDDRIQGTRVDMGCYEGAEYAAPPGQVTGLVAVRGVLRWDAMPDAEGFMVYRSTRRAASSAKYIGMAETNAYTDETAVDGTTYYYWVTAFNTLGMGTRSDVAENSWPILLAITTSELPDAVEMTEYSAQLEATGGTAPYAWEVGLYGYVVSREASSFRDDSGAAQGWNADDNAWSCNLPFAFPFYGKAYTNLYVSSNGTISFGKEVHSWSYSESTFKATPMISVLWNDLTTSGTGLDVFVEANGTRATIRWRGTYLGGQAVNFSATLYETGDIRLAYGAGNAKGGYIGVSAGDGQQRQLVGSSGASWANARDVVFSTGAFVPSAAVLPFGVSFSSSGLLHGTPTEAGTANLVFRVTDSAGGHDIRELPFTVAANPNERPVIESVTPTNTVTFVKVGDSQTFSVVASDPEGNPLSYRWTVDGENVEGEDAECYTYRPSADDAGNVRVLTCFVADDLWVDKVLTNWTVKVPRTIYVDVATTNEEWAVDGSAPELAYPSLSRALDYAEIGDTILVAPGVYSNDGQYDDGYLYFRSYGIGYGESGAVITVKSMAGAEHTTIQGTVYNYDHNHWQREDWVRYYYGGYYDGYYEQSPALPVLEGFTLCCSAVQGVSLVNCSVKGGDDGAETSGLSGCSLSNCTVTGCCSSYELLSSCELTRCTVAGNTVPDGCFAVDEGSLVIDSIVHGNMTAAGVAANYNPSIYQGYAWEETEDGYREWTVDVPCVVFTNSCACPLPTMAGSDGNIADDPRLVDAANGDLRLRVGSPCIVDGIQTMGAWLGGPVAGHVLSVRIEGHGAVSPMTAIVEDGGSATFGVAESIRPFLGFSTNDVFATASDLLVWQCVKSDGIVTAVFSNFTFHVDAATGDDANDGLSWGTAKASIQAAVGEALDGEAVYVKPGTYGPINSNGKRIRIESVDGKAATIIDGGGTNRCATLGWTTNALVRGFRLTNGKASEGGAAYYGTLEDCDVVGNVATGYGGGLYYSVAIRCRIMGNIVQGSSWYARGGGAYRGMLRNCLVAGNAADCSDSGNGGGTYYGTHYNCTIVSNSVSGTSCQGGGAYGGTHYNTIVYGNLATNVPNEVNFVNAYNSLVGIDPLFADSDYRPAAGSLCIDSGNNNYVIDDIDLDGNERIQHYTVDIGCYEYALATPERDADADFAAQMAGTCYGVFVGVGRYTYTSSLTGPTIDATNMQARCMTNGYWHDTNTVALLDTAATKNAVRAHLFSLADKAVSGDTVLYYQSSHGGNNYDQYGNMTKDTCICLHDETYEDYEMAEDLMRFAAGVKVVIVLDTCHSAGMFKSMGKASSASAKSFAVRVRELMTERSALRKGVKSGIAADDIGWIAAADYNQYSYDSPRGGAFTVALLDGWKTGAADYDGDKRLNFHELWRYAKGIATGYGGEDATDAQCLNEEVLLSRFAGIPDTSNNDDATATTPVPVTHVWLDSYPEILSSVGGDYESMANAPSPGASGSGKTWPNGSPCYVWQDFVAGTSPTNDTVFTATIRMEGDTPVITWEPDTPELRATRVYRTLGKKTLIDANWTDVTDKDKSEYNFFMVTVELPK